MSQPTKLRIGIVGCGRATEDLHMPALRTVRGVQVTALSDNDAGRLHRGRPMLYAADAVVYHCHPLTLTRFCRQHFTYGRGAVHFHRIRAERGSGSMRREMAFHLGLPRLLRLLPEMNKIQMLRRLPLLVLWQIANLTGFIYENFRRNGYDRRLRCS